MCKFFLPFKFSTSLFALRAEGLQKDALIYCNLDVPNRKKHFQLLRNIGVIVVTFKITRPVCIGFQDFWVEL